ncbi:hypothetical protein AURDEDRAFT_165679 [Auricularia subglabra TFB-10046 SS5]|nr:hypothetical protein AURDEDRAFT_165679 [Auricularia subglabra TFB-10046 SS5]
MLVDLSPTGSEEPEHSWDSVDDSESAGDNVKNYYPYRPNQRVYSPVPTRTHGGDGDGDGDGDGHGIRSSAGARAWTRTRGGGAGAINVPEGGLAPARRFTASLAELADEQGAHARAEHATRTPAPSTGGAAAGPTTTSPCSTRPSHSPRSSSTSVLPVAR